jgi:hypothetical protein
MEPAPDLPQQDATAYSVEDWTIVRNSYARSVEEEGTPEP